jgi:hypothetical protein
VDDKYYKALGRTVHTFQTLEWITVNIYALVAGAQLEGPDWKTFNSVIGPLKARLKKSPWSKHTLGAPLRSWAETLGELNRLRDDVFHSYPVGVDRVLRRSKKQGLIEIDLDQLFNAHQQFKAAAREGRKLWTLLQHAATEAGATPRSDRDR